MDCWQHLYQKGHKNILEDFIYVTFRSMQYAAMVRANALVDILISRPMRWLSVESAQLVNWSPRSMGEVLDIAQRFFIRAQHDGSLFLDPQLDLFKPIADQQPLFAQWRRYTFECETVSSPSGSAKQAFSMEVCFCGAARPAGRNKHAHTDDEDS